MLLCKFKVLLVSFLTLCCQPLLAFDENQCFKQSFNVEVIHKGQPFGLLPVKLKIGKEGCILTVQHEKFKYLKNAWQIDICREPVHIKKGLGAVEVVKKTVPCEGKERGPFCTQFLTMKKMIQDDGLIFAEGEKESLASNHGKVYCSYLLLNKYLEESLVFNRGDDYTGILTAKPSAQLYQSGSQGGSEISPPTIPEAPKPEMVEGSSDTPLVEEDGQSVSTPTAEPQMEEGSQSSEKSGQGSF